MPPVDTSIALASSIAASTPAGAGYAGAVLKAASVVKPAGLVKSLVERMMHPEVYVLRKFADDVALVRDKVGIIERLWGHEVDRKWLATASRISQHSSRDSGRLWQRQ